MRARRHDAHTEPAPGAWMLTNVDICRSLQPDLDIWDNVPRLSSRCQWMAWRTTKYYIPADAGAVQLDASAMEPEPFADFPES